MSDDGYCGFEVGDTVRRVAGSWNTHSVGTVDVVMALENRHLRFAKAGDCGRFGGSPRAYELVRKASPVKDLFVRRTQDTLMRGGQA